MKGLANMAELTQEQAIEHWTELHRRISVGAYEELSAEHHETGTYPEDGIKESIVNLETWADRQGLDFVWDTSTRTWSLVPIEQGSE
jgi:hypothetical protein